MPLGFIKKLAGKLLGKTEQEKKPLAKKPEPARKGGARPEAARVPGRDKPDGGAGNRPGSRKGARPDVSAGRPPRGRGQRGDGAGGRPVREQKDGAPATATSRPVARPPFKDQQRRGRGPDSGERPASDARARRPGGAVADAEQAALRAEHAKWTVDQYQVPSAEGKKRFQDFDLPTEILHAVADLGFQYCTPIQASSLEFALAGKNVAGKAQTGTGKTAAFLVAILTRYLRSPEARQEKGGAPRALVIAPTRELVIQICKDAAALGKYCGLRSLAVYGGMDYERQKREVMDAPVDLLVATPGRLLDFVRSRVIDLSKVDTLVIDEADRMLDMGFIPDVRSIISRLPPKDKRCTMLYSATLTDDVMRLASQWMEAPERVEIESEQVTTKTVKQIVYVVTANEKFTVLYNQIQQYPDSRMLIFCNRRNTTEDVADSLSRRGIRCEMLSGDVNQNRRVRVLEDFREGKVRIVVATDVAGRGLHVDDIGFVINFDFPYEPEDYVHRIGRTGRAGASGTAISFADEDESFIIPDIEKYIGEELKCTVLQNDDPLLAKLPPKPHRGPAPAHTDREPRHETHHAGSRHGAQDEEHRAREPRPAAPAPVEAAAPAAAESHASAVVPEARAAAAVKQPVAVSVTPPAPVPAVPKASVPTAGPAAARKPRFSEEWVPGQGAK